MEKADLDRNFSTKADLWVEKDVLNRNFSTKTYPLVEKAW